jgi:hypothetical protein
MSPAYATKPCPFMASPGIVFTTPAQPPGGERGSACIAACLSPAVPCRMLLANMQGIAHTTHCRMTGLAKPGCIITAPAHCPALSVPPQELPYCSSTELSQDARATSSISTMTCAGSELRLNPARSTAQHLAVRPIVGLLPCLTQGGCCVPAAPVYASA